MTRAMIFVSGLPITFWGDAAKYSTYLWTGALRIKILRERCRLKFWRINRRVCATSWCLSPTVPSIVTRARTRSRVVLKWSRSWDAVTKQRVSEYSSGRKTMSSQRSMSRILKCILQLRTGSCNRPLMTINGKMQIKTLRHQHHRAVLVLRARIPREVTLDTPATRYKRYGQKSSCKPRRSCQCWCHQSRFERDPQLWRSCTKEQEEKWIANINAWGAGRF